MASVEDLIRQYTDQAAATLDGGLLDFYAGGSGRELSLEEATAAWAAYRFRPRVLRDVSAVDVSVELFGQRLPNPVLVAPMAYQALLHPGGEIEMARGAAAAGSSIIVSTRASRRIEDIAEVSGPWWLQAYVTADRRLIEGLVKRAVRCGASAIVLTGDTPYAARKARAGRPLPIGGPETMVNLGEHLSPGGDPALDAEQDPTITLEAIGWLAELSGLPVLVKGVLSATEATACVDAGAAGLIVSNHGGRQLDRAVATAFALPDVVAAAGSVPVLVDGGLSSAFDVLVALALGARAVLVGRPLLWALFSAGAAGVQAVLDAFAHDLAHAMGLAGYRHTAELSDELVIRAPLF